MRVSGEQMANTQPQWVPMKLNYLGNVQALLQQGGGKLSADVGDPGEPRKVPSTA
jgi:hypothetical protein